MVGLRDGEKNLKTCLFVLTHHDKTIVVKLSEYSGMGSFHYILQVSTPCNVPLGEVCCA